MGGGQPVMGMMRLPQPSRQAGRHVGARARGRLPPTHTPRTPASQQHQRQPKSLHEVDACGVAGAAEVEHPQPVARQRVGACSGGGAGQAGRLAVSVGTRERLENTRQRPAAPPAS